MFATFLWNEIKIILNKIHTETIWFRNNLWKGSGNFKRLPMTRLFRLLLLLLLSFFAAVSLIRRRVRAGAGTSTSLMRFLALFCFHLLISFIFWHDCVHFGCLLGCIFLFLLGTKQSRSVYRKVVLRNMYFTFASFGIPWSFPLSDWLGLKLSLIPNASFALVFLCSWATENSWLSLTLKKWMRLLLTRKTP